MAALFALLFSDLLKSCFNLLKCNISRMRIILPLDRTGRRRRPLLYLYVTCRAMPMSGSV
jgi:hypothetical protein